MQMYVFPPFLSGVSAVLWDKHGIKVECSQLGEARLRNRIISHPDVGQKWYPDLYARFSQEKLV